MWIERKKFSILYMNETPSISTRYIANRPVQELLPRDHQYRREYCRWLLHKNIDEPDFLNHVLWTDEEGFTRDGIMNMHNLHVWSDVNPHATRPISFQHRFSVNVWAGIIDNNLIGPYIMEDRINGARYLNFLDNKIHILLEDIPLHTRRQMWYQLDGAPAHFTRPEMVYNSVIENRDHLVQRIHEAAAHIRQRRFCDNLKHEVLVCAELCLRNRGAHIEHLLQ
ncbi:uncharacterized protein LOC113562590 [Ooceraea biroi]|uniref:uncharacterized protein LOC113562590 n=1 Tax=Ooceraea biroi TaxID=2015173 RepID=UPI000F075A22|nr:uncharacterized protein LOC113562590 [Ooceraea biroi]